MTIREEKLETSNLKLSTYTFSDRQTKTNTEQPFGVGKKTRQMCELDQAHFNAKTKIVNYLEILLFIAWINSGDKV